MADHEPIILQEHQKDHVQRLLDIVGWNYFYVDGSEMGTGKTIVSLYIAQTLGLPIIVFCPLVARMTWLIEREKYGIPIYPLPGKYGGVVTYDTLRGIAKKSKLEHGLLTMSEVETKKNGTTVVKYSATPFLRKIIREGVLFVFDEAQKVKNNTNQHRAVKAILDEMRGTDGLISRAGFLSGTIADKPVHVANLLECVSMLGYTEDDMVLTLMNWGKANNPVGLERFMFKRIPVPTRREDREKYLYKFFLDVVKPVVMSIMPSLKLPKDIKNGYFIIDPRDAEAYEVALAELEFAVTIRADPRETTIIMTQVTGALIALQKAKYRTMIRVAKKTLETPMYDDKGNKLTPKVILYVDYMHIVDALIRELKDYNPVELTGRVKEDDRRARVQLFNAPNSNCRVLVANPVVGGMSINLHDTTGLYPRYMYIMPGFLVNELHQATGRIYRVGYKGKAIVRFFYIKGYDGRETRIMDAMARKGAVLGSVHREQGALFPNEYQDEEEVDPELEAEYAKYPRKKKVHFITMR